MSLHEKAMTDGFLRKGGTRFLSEKCVGIMDRGIWERMNYTMPERAKESTDVH